MNYQELLEMAKRAVSANPEAGVENLLDVVQVLGHHNPITRAIATDRLAFLLAEYIEAPVQQAARSAKH